MTYDIKESFEKRRIAGSIAAGALDEVAKIVKPGISTDEIDKLCYEFINDHKAYSAPLFYRGFPKSCCTSVNHIVCHGIPSNKYLNEGDIITIRGFGKYKMAEVYGKTQKDRLKVKILKFT